VNLDCPKCEKPLIVERPKPLGRDLRLAGSKCTACGVVLSDEDIHQAIKNALSVLLERWHFVK
jgi:hypothetical protein